MPSPSRSKCMDCAKPPTHECRWAEGMGRAWFCDEHWEKWSAAHKGDINTHRKVKGGVVGEKYGEDPKTASARDGKKTGDRSGVGFFIPLPEELADQFPSLGAEDHSPPHTTFLYVGEVPEDREAEFLSVSRAALADLRGPVRGHLEGPEYFIHADKDRRVAVMHVRFDHDLAGLRWRLRDALIDAGFAVDDSFPLIYRPHATLAYMDGLAAEYDGPVPTGDWMFDGMEVWGLPRVHTVEFGAPGRTAAQYRDAMRHRVSVALMRFLSGIARRLGVAEHIYIVGGAVRNFVIKEPIKDIDVVVDSVALGQGKDSAWFAKQVMLNIPVETSLVTNNYGVAILTVKGNWMVEGENLAGETIEIANARKESYGGSEGKGYKPHMVEPATILEDTVRREFTFNTLLWRLYDLADGPDKAEILDLTGCGLRDLQEGMMRCPSSPDKTFSDDPSRMVRAVKFLIKYGFRISPEVEASIRRNREMLRNIPAGHLSNMIINLFYEGGVGKRALLEMDKLGLLDVVKDIARTDRAFREALGNWAEKRADLAFLFDLMDIGMPTGKALNFLTDAERSRVRAITVGMDAREGEEFIGLLEQPGKVVDMAGLIAEFGLRGVEIRRLTNNLRAALLDDPTLALSGARLTERVRQDMGAGVRTAVSDPPRPVASVLATIVRKAREMGYRAERLGTVGDLPIVLLRPGTEPALGVPRILVMGGIHGNEPSGAEACLRVLGCLPPNVSMSLIPVVNPIGVRDDKRTGWSGDDPNRGMTNGKPTPEGVTLMEHADLLRHLGEHGVLTLHEDNEQTGFYTHISERRGTPGPVAAALVAAGQAFFKPVTAPEDDPGLGNPIDNGLVFQPKPDTSIEDWLFDRAAKAGVRVIATTEVPSAADWEKRVACCLAFIRAFAESVPAQTAARTAGIFEGPPAMISSITEWMRSLIAGQALANVDRKLAQAGDQSGPLQRAIEMLEKAHDEVEAKIRAMTSPGEEYRLDINVPGVPRWILGVRRHEHIEGYYEVAAGDMQRLVYRRGSGARTDHAIRWAQGQIWQEAESLRYRVRRGPSVGGADLVDLHLLRTEALKYAGAAKSYATKVSRKFTIDLTGWKYVQAGSPVIDIVNKQVEKRNKEIASAIEFGQMELERAQDLYDRAKKGEDVKQALWDMGYNAATWFDHQIREAINEGKRPAELRARIDGTVWTADDTKKMVFEPVKPDEVEAAIKKKWGSEITATLFFTTHKKRAGQWSSSRRELQVDTGSAHYIDSVRDFRDTMFWVEQTVRHEVQHIGQDLLREMKGLREDAGLPSRNLRDVTHDPSGYATHGKGRGRILHPLRDVEFYTDLADAVDSFMQGLSRYPKEDYRAYFRTFVGVPLGMDERRGYPHSHFQTWKQKSPDKWKKAVAEFLKAVTERGFDLPGRPVKVAETFTMNRGDPVFFGKYKNKPGRIKDFKKDEKSGDPIVVIEPDPKGRKDDKDIKLFKIRERTPEPGEADKMAARRVARRYLTGTDDIIRVIDFVRGYKQITGVRRIPVARNVDPRTKAESLIIGNDEIDRLGLRIPGKDYLSDDEMARLFKGEVVIEEKVDGHSVVVLYGGYTFFCEALRIRHTVEYDNVPYSEMGWPDMTVVFDVLDGEIEPPYRYGQGTGKWLSRSEKETLCRMVGAPLVPLVFRGHLTPETLPALADRLSVFGSNKAEGVVVKNFGTGVFGKFINLEFQRAIADEATWGGTHPELKGVRNVRRFSPSAARVAARYIQAAFSKCRWRDLPAEEQGKQHPECPVPEDILKDALLQNLGRIGGFHVWEVDGCAVRDRIDIDFTQGGNPAVYGYIPTSNVWVEKKPSPKDFALTTLHEVVEATVMDEDGLDYEKAHERASAIENYYREHHGELPDLRAAYEWAKACFEGWQARRWGWAGPNPVTPLLPEFEMVHGLVQMNWTDAQGQQASRLYEPKCFPQWFDRLIFEVADKMAMRRVAAKYKDKKQVETKDGDEVTVYEYSDQQVANRNREKAKKVEHLRKSIGDLRAQVKKDIHSEDEHTRAVALAVGLMDVTYERVGNDESAKDGHFGVTGWQVKHLTFGKGKVTVKYVGKSGVKHEKVIDSAESVTALKKAVEGKGENDTVVDCDAADVNEYLKPFGVSAKDIRGYHANTEMQTRLKATRSKGGRLPEDKKEREKALKDEFKRALEETAEAVGHEPSTLKSQYLVPGLEDEYLKDGTVTQSLDKKADFSPNEGHWNNRWDLVEGGTEPPPDEPFEKWTPETYPWAFCPVCGAKYKTTCRCRIGHKTCPNGHEWVWCKVHVKPVVLPEGLDTHKAGIPFEGCRCRWSDPEFVKKAIAVTEALTQKFLGRVATKTPAEKEDEEAERLVRPDPKKKPPRHDLRRERVRDEDDDTGKATVDDDPDLSLNYKKVAARWLMAKVVEALNKRQRKKEDKKRREQNPDQHKPPAPLPKPPKAPEPEAKKIKVRLKDTGQVVEVTEDTLKKEPGKYEEYKPGDEGAAPEAPGGVPSAPEDEGKKAPTAPPKPDSVEGWVAGMDEGRLDEALSGLKSQFAPSKKQNSMFGDKPDTETLDSPLAVQVLAGLKIPGGLFKTVGDVRAFLKNKKLHGTVGTGKAPAAEAPAPKAPPATPAAPATPATPEAPAAAPDEEKATPERQKAQEALDKLGEALAEGGPWGKDEELDDSDPLTDPHVMEKLKELGVEIPEAVAKGLKTLGGLRKALKNPKKITRDWARAIAAPKPVDEAEQLRGQFGETVKGLTEAHPELAESLSGMSDADKAAASAAFSTRMRSLRGTYQQSGLTPDLLKAARAGSSPGAIKNTATPAARGEALAAYRFAHAVLADPSLVGGQPISDEPKDETALQKRAEAAYEQYRTLGPELRQSAIEMAAKQMRELDRNSPRFRELNRVVDGLALAHMPESLFVGDRLIREPPSPAFSTLVARLNEKDTVGLLLRPTESLNSPSGREVLQDAVGTLSDEELIGLHGGESGPFRGLFSDEDEGEGWEDLPSGYKEIFRGLMREWAVRDMTIGHACFMSGARRSKAKKPRDIREFVDKCHREVEGHPDVKKALDSFTECMKKAVTQEDLEGCKKAEAEADKAQLAAYIDVRKRHFGEIPDDDPVAAKIRRVIETGDVTELEKKYIRERDRHREQFVGWDEGGDDEYGSPWFSGGSDHDFD